MRFGVHVSLSGGLQKALKEAARLQLECMQIFSGNPRGWKQKVIKPSEAEAFRRGVAELGISPVVVHAPYLINPAAPDEEMWQKSVDGLAHQLERAAMLGCVAVVVHPGSRKEMDLCWGLKRVAQAAEAALSLADTPARLWLENTVGGGGQIGGPVSQLKAVMDLASEHEIGVCLDTAHALGAGYNIQTARGAKRFLDHVDRVISLEKVGLWHFNDSMAPRASRRDRHTHIGKGEIGLAGFQALVKDPRLRDHAAVLETPKPSPWADKRNLAVLRRFRQEP